MKSNAPLTEWLTALTTALSSGTIVKLSLSKPTPAAGVLKSIDARPIMVKGQLKLSFTYHNKTNDIVKNYNATETTGRLVKLLRESFTAARLQTTEGDLHLSVQGKTYTLTRHPASQTEAPSLTHDRTKQRTIKSTQTSYLHALGITDATGTVLKSFQDKFRQINKYVEILDSLIKQLPEGTPLRIADMGSGKGYLTFALYDHLINTMKREAHVTGVEFRPELVKLCNDIARASTFTNLTFTQGSIADYDCTNTNVIIALHACDTATDDALAKAVKANAQLIVVAPCCHKQIRREMAKSAANENLTFLTQYGSYAERIAEMVTDGIRAQLLQLSGYTTNVFEFISGEHTPKNVMITAIRRTKPLTTSEITQLQFAIASAKTHFGIGKHWLETLLPS